MPERLALLPRRVNLKSPWSSWGGTDPLFPRELVVIVNDQETGGSNPLLVHVGVIEVGNLAGIGTGRRVGLGCFFNQASHTLAGQVVRVVEVAAVGVNVIAIGRKFGALDPGAIGVAVEIVTRPDRAVHVGDDDAVSLLFGRVLGESAEWSEGEESACCGGNEDNVPKV